MEIGEKITCSRVENKEEIIRFFYEKEDSEWHLFVHKRHGTVEQNIADTLGTISEDSIMYVVYDEGNLAGFFVKFKNEQGYALEGFHIGKEFRVKWFVREFWRLVRVKFGDNDISCGLHSMNHYAINHLIRQGFKQVNEIVVDDKNYVILLLKMF